MQSLIIRISKTGFGAVGCCISRRLWFWLYIPTPLCQPSALSHRHSLQWGFHFNPAANQQLHFNQQNTITFIAERKLFHVLLANHFLFCLQNPTCIMFRFQLIFDPYGKAYRYHQWSQPQSAGQA
jgi:hypothetical protein